MLKILGVSSIVYFAIKALLEFWCESTMQIDVNFLKIIDFLWFYRWTNTEYGQFGNKTRLKEANTDHQYQQYYEGE